MFYIFLFQYTPNTAYTNRLLGYFQALDDLGVETTVVCMYPDDNYSRMEQTFRHIHVEYMWTRRSILYSGRLKMLSYRMYVNKFLRRLKYGDTVYTYCVSDLVRQVQKVKGVKTFGELTEHPDAVNGGFENPLTAMSMDEKYDVCRRLDGLFVISSPLREHFIDRGVAADKVHIINMTVDVARFKGLKKQDVADRYIAYCGTVSNNKDGVDELIKAFALISHTFEDVKLYIIGKTPSHDDKSGNIALIQRLGVKDKVVFTGLVSAENMPQLLKNAEVLALNRPDGLQAQHGFPTKLGEYLLSGNPVVVTTVGDIPKFLVDGQSALLCAPGNTEVFAAKLAWAMTHRDEVLSIGNAGADVAMKNFNSAVETRKLAGYMGLL